MPVRTRLIIQGTPFSDEIAAIEAIDEMMIEGAQETTKVIQPLWLDEATYYPPPAKLPFQFGSKKSRNYYFAVIVKNRKSSGGRYARTKKLQQSFFMKLLQSQRGVEFVFGSNSDITKYVVGNFDKNRNHQVPGHHNTGWPLIADTTAFWMTATEEDFLKRMPTIYAKFDARRQNR